MTMNPIEFGSNTSKKKLFLVTGSFLAGFIVYLLRASPRQCCIANEYVEMLNMHYEFGWRAMFMTYKGYIRAADQLMFLMITKFPTARIPELKFLVEMTMSGIVCGFLAYATYLKTKRMLLSALVVVVMLFTPFFHGATFFDQATPNLFMIIGLIFAAVIGFVPMSRIGKFSFLLVLALYAFSHYSALVIIVLLIINQYIHKKYDARFLVSCTVIVVLGTAVQLYVNSLSDRTPYGTFSVANAAYTSRWLFMSPFPFQFRNIYMTGPSMIQNLIFLSLFVAFGVLILLVVKDDLKKFESRRQTGLFPSLFLFAGTLLFAIFYLPTGTRFVQSLVVPQMFVGLGFLFAAYVYKWKPAKFSMIGLSALFILMGAFNFRPNSEDAYFYRYQIVYQSSTRQLWENGVQSAKQACRSERNDKQVTFVGTIFRDLPDVVTLVRLSCSQLK